jgi:hypothetical protein
MVAAAVSFEAVFPGDPEGRGLSPFKAGLALIHAVKGETA